MSDRKNCSVSELLANKALNWAFRYYVNVGSRFIEHDDPAAAKYGSDNTNQLPFANRKILAFLLDFEFQTDSLGRSIIVILRVLPWSTACQDIIEAGPRNKVSDPLIRVLIKRVNVEAKGPSEESWILWNNCDCVSEIFEVNIGDVLAINQNLTRFNLYNTRQSQEKGRFSSSGTPYDSNFLTCRCFETNTGQGAIAARPITKGYIPELEVPRLRPTFGSALTSKCKLLRRIM